MAGISEMDRLEIYEGWVAVGMHIIRSAAESADLPVSFQWEHGCAV